MRPNTSSKMPQTMIEVVDEPSPGSSPSTCPTGSRRTERPWSSCTATITNVAVRVPLLGPVEVTVYVPGAVGAAVKVTVAVPTAAACCGRTRPATGDGAGRRLRSWVSTGAG